MTATAHASSLRAAWWSVPTAVTPRSRGWRGCAAGCVPTTASSTSPTGAACAPPTSRPRLWLLDPEAAAMFPNEDDVTVLVAGFHRAQLADVRADPEAAYQRLVRGLPEGPDLGGAERDIQADRRARRAQRDAPGRQARASRSSAMPRWPPIPLFGVGCGWAFQSAEWLVDQTAAALARRRRPRRRAGPLPPRLPPSPAALTTGRSPTSASGRPLRANERMGIRAAAADPVYARAVEEVTSRRRSPLRLFEPRLTRMMVSSGPDH